MKLIFTQIILLLKASKTSHLPLTCCSNVMITSTAIFNIPNFVWGLSVFKCVIHIRPSSLRASFMSRIRILQNNFLNKIYSSEYAIDHIISYIFLALLQFFEQLILVEKDNKYCKNIQYILNTNEYRPKYLRKSNANTIKS